MQALFQAFLRRTEVRACNAGDPPYANDIEITSNCVARLWGAADKATRPFGEVMKGVDKTIPAEGTLFSGFSSHQKLLVGRLLCLLPLCSSPSTILDVHACI